MKENKTWQTIGVLLLIGVIMFVFNHLMPLHRDDYEYSLVWNTAQHITSLSAVFTSLVRHYLEHGGRMVTVLGLDLFLYLGKTWFDLANVLAFILLTVEVFCHARRTTNWRTEPLTLLVSSFLLWLCLPHFGEVAIWKSGSTVYLWSAVPVGLFLLPYNLASLPTKVQHGAAFSVAWFLLGIVAGWSVENLAVTTVVVAALTTLRAQRQKYLQSYMVTGLIGSLLGCLGLLAAPGNYVRYTDQGAGKGILAHVGNQIAGNAEMLLYILPLVLMTLLMLRVLRLEQGVKKGLAVPALQKTSNLISYLFLIFIGILTFSYFNGGFIAANLRDFLVAHVLTPLGQTRPKTLFLFANLMSGFEEMVIYWLGLFLIYGWLKKSLPSLATFSPEQRSLLSYKNLWQEVPALHYPLCLVVLALFNNFVMLAAPTFPARATFSSVVMLIMAFIALAPSVLNLQHITLQPAFRILKAGALALALFTLSGTFYILTKVQQADQAAIQIIKNAGEHHIAVPTVEPFPFKNRMLRHVFYIDFTNGVTKKGARAFFNVEDIKVKGL